MLLQADARAIPLQDETVQCVVTSPPYWALRDYGGWLQMVLWGTMADFPRGRRVGARRHWLQLATRASRRGWLTRGQSHIGALGLEPTPELYVAHMVEVFREVRRVLRPDGTLWLNLGDSYVANAHKGTVSRRRDRAPIPRTDTLDHGGLPIKNLLMMPHRVALALQADGWWVRSDIVWSKPNPMPESVTDRPTKAHEYVFLCAKSPRYFYDADAIREPGTSGPSDLRKMEQQRDRIGGKSLTDHAPLHAANASTNIGQKRGVGTPGTRNARTVWTIATQPYPGAHFATYPEKLVEPCILAGSSPKACGVCAAPWERVTERGIDPNYIALGDRPPHGATQPGNATIKPGAFGDGRPATTTGWRSTCEHDDDSGSCVVLDPFAGSGTTLRVATRLGRQAVGLDISREYLTEQATKRTTDIQIGLEAMGL